MPTDPAPFRVRHDDDELPIDFGAPDFPMPSDVIAHVAAFDVDYDWVVPGICRRFEVWQGGVMVATARRDGETDNFVEGPPFDEMGGLPPRVADLFGDFAKRPK